jgi:hypothetical protein
LAFKTQREKKIMFFVFTKSIPLYIPNIKEAQEEKNDVAQKFMLYCILFRNIWIATECFRFTLTLFEK